MMLSFCQNDSLMGESFWQKDSLITHILFELWLILIFSPVEKFAQQSLRGFWWYGIYVLGPCKMNEKKKIF